MWKYSFEIFLSIASINSSNNMELKNDEKSIFRMLSYYLKVEKILVCSSGDNFVTR